MDENTIAVLIFFVGLFTSITLVLFIYINHFRLEKIEKVNRGGKFEEQQVRRES